MNGMKRQAWNSDRFDFEHLLISDEVFNSGGIELVTAPNAEQPYWEFSFKAGHRLITTHAVSLRVKEKEIKETPQSKKEEVRKVRFKKKRD
jgi:hypothetical protein